MLAETSEAAREGAALVHVDVTASDHEVDMDDTDDAYAPDKVNPAYPTDTTEGDVEAALAGAEVVVEQTYRTPFEHNNPMEPHAILARWEEREDGPFLDVFDSTQGVHGVRQDAGPVAGPRAGAGAGPGAVRRWRLRQQGPAAQPRGGGRPRRPHHRRSSR